MGQVVPLLLQALQKKHTGMDLQVSGIDKLLGLIHSQVEEKLHSKTSGKDSGNKDQDRQHKHGQWMGQIAGKTGAAERE